MTVVSSRRNIIILAVSIIIHVIGSLIPTSVFHSNGMIDTRFYYFFLRTPVGMLSMQYLFHYHRFMH